MAGTARHDADAAAPQCQVLDEDVLLIVDDETELASGGCSTTASSSQRMTMGASSVPLVRNVTPPG